jgi:F420H(2)-dependent quinone reductase
MKSTTNPDVAGADALDEAQVCYLATVGRRSQRAHTIEIWFTAAGRSLYLISGGGAAADWVKNLQSEPTGSVRVHDNHLNVRGRTPLPDGTERVMAIERLHAKYQHQISSSVQAWIRDAYIVALDLVEASA